MSTAREFICDEMCKKKKQTNGLQLLSFYSQVFLTWQSGRLLRLMSVLLEVQGDVISCLCGVRTLLGGTGRESKLETSL